MNSNVGMEEGMPFNFFETLTRVVNDLTGNFGEAVRLGSFDGGASASQVPPLPQATTRWVQAAAALRNKHRRTTPACREVLGQERWIAGAAANAAKRV